MTELQPSIEILPPVIKGKSDWREYRALRLQNGVTCMVVNDKESKTTAMSCAVAVGAAADPREMSGLAHFCEHMCFLGSEKYPGENEYKKYLSSHGGHSNASTSLHLTTYKFDVLAAFAEHAVDIFSNFFISPLFTLSGTAREVQAVDSENSKNLTSDGRRRLQIIKALADPDHYYSKFTTGNALTLPAESGDTAKIRAALLAFHRYHYQPENMTVVIVGPQSLDQLQDWVVPRFGAIVRKELENPSGEVEMMIIDAAADMPEYVFGRPVPEYRPAFSSELQNHQWPVLLTVKPLQSMRKLTLNFPVPPCRNLFNRNPTNLLSHLLGHEGPGSSFAVLQTAGLITSLSSGTRISGPDQTVFQLELSLTEEGEKEWKSIVALLLEHCRLIARAPDLQRHWEESRELSEIHFNHASPGQAYDTAPNLAQSIVAYGTEFCQSAGRLVDKDAPAAQEFASYLTAENCIIERCSEAAWEEMEALKFFAHFGRAFGKKVEPWYGIEYYLVPVVDCSGWNEMTPTALLDPSRLHLPSFNRFIPRSLELVDELPDEAKQGPRIEKEIDPPTLLFTNGIGRLWHRLDDRYALPKSSLDVFIRHASVQHSLKGDEWEFDPQASIHSSLLSSVFAQALAQETYDATLAGLHWSLSASSSGIRLSCTGFSDRLPDLAIKVLRDFLDGDFVSESYVETTKDRTVRNLSTYLSSRRADSHALHYQNLLFSQKQTVIDVSLDFAKNASLDSIKEHHRRLVQSTEFEVDCFFTGNVSERSATDFFAMVTQVLGRSKPPNASTQIRLYGSDTRRLPLGKSVELHFASKNSHEENGAVLMTFQSQIPAFRGVGLSCPESLQSTASIRLLCHMLREPLFNTLRTKQQLGYVVQSYYDVDFAQSNATTTAVDFIAINVLSRKLSPPDVATRIDDFLTDFRASLLKMPESQIHDHASALSTTLLKPIQKLATESSIHFSKIHRFGPEVLRAGGRDSDIPWNSVRDLAAAIQSLEREDLVSTWDRVVLSSNRSRVTSMVYGSTFPLDERAARMRATSTTNVVVDSTSDLVKLRGNLKAFDNTVVRPNPILRYLPSPTPVRLGLTAAAIGVIAFTVHSRRAR